MTIHEKTRETKRLTGLRRKITLKIPRRLRNRWLDIRLFMQGNRSQKKKGGKPPSDESATLGVGFRSPSAHNIKQSRTHTSKHVYATRTRRRYADVPSGFLCAVARTRYIRKLQGQSYFISFSARKVDGVFCATTLLKRSPWKAWHPTKTNKRRKSREISNHARSGEMGRTRKQRSPTKGRRAT